MTNYDDINRQMSRAEAHAAEEYHSARRPIDEDDRGEDETFVCDRCDRRSDEQHVNHLRTCVICGDAIDDGQPWPARDDHREIEDAIRALAVLTQAANAARSYDWRERQTAQDKMRLESVAALNRLDKSKRRGDSPRVIRLEEEIWALAMAMAQTSASLDRDLSESQPPLRWRFGRRLLE